MEKYKEHWNLQINHFYSCTCFVCQQKRKSLHENKWSWTTCTKDGKNIRHLVLNARDLPDFLAFDLTYVTGSSVGNATWLDLLRHSLAFTSIHRAWQRTSAYRAPASHLTAEASALPDMRALSQLVAHQVAQLGKKMSFLYIFGDQPLFASCSVKGRS